MTTIEQATTPAPRPAEGRRAEPRHYLMCRPAHFTVAYRINPWMNPELPTSTARAVAQWEALRSEYLRLGHRVELIDPLPGQPDMVYAANGGFTLDGIAYAPRFAHPERAGEAPAYAEWFERAGFRVVRAAEVNEGEGDLLLAGDAILAGWGFRSSLDSHAEVARVFGREVVSLRLVDPRFYHLDTALAVLDPVGSEVTVAYLPSAFDDESQSVLARRFPDAIRLTEEDAGALALNCVSDGRNVLLPARAEVLAARLAERGVRPIGVELDELLLGGGGPKCCTLELRP